MMSPEQHADRHAHRDQRQGQHGAVPLPEQREIEEAQERHDSGAPAAEGMAHQRDGGKGRRSTTGAAPAMALSPSPRVKPLAKTPTARSSGTCSAAEIARVTA
jgi:hypothetical protein